MRNVKLKELKPLTKNPHYSWYEPRKRLLYDSLVENGYVKKKGVIKVTYDNYIIDGHHRHYILSKFYGDEYVIEILRIPINRKIYVGFLYLLTIIFIPFLLIYYIITKVFYGKSKG